MRKKLTGIFSIILIITMVLAGCNTAGNGSSASDNGDTSGGNSASGSGDASASGGGSSQAAAVTTSSKIVVDKEFTANDLEVGYEDSTATHITLNGSGIKISGNGAASSGEVLTINQEGTYVIEGNLDNGQIVVDAGEKDKVKLILNGVSVTCADNAPIYIKSADKVFIILAEGTENTLTDGSAYVQKDENNVDGVIFSKADLTINGKGTLNITANYKHGIVSKDDLVFAGGTYNIKAAKNAIDGKDCVKIKDGTFQITSTGKGITSKNEDDETKGYVYISGGSITITDCSEGIEGTAIVVEGGTIDITSRDDGFNSASASSSTTGAASTETLSAEHTSADITSADITSADTALTGITLTSTASTSESSDDAASSATMNDNRGQDRMGPGNFGGGGGEFENNTNCYITISGGSISINASGDGIDSNGSLYISGGDIYVSGPTESMNGGLDYNGTAEITGGTIVVAGSVGMAQGFSDTSTQYSLLYNFTDTCAAGTDITLTDKDGNVIASYTPDKLYQSVVISTPKLASGETYKLTCGDQTADITLDSIVTSNGQQGMGFPGMGGQRQGGMPWQGSTPGQGDVPDQGTMPNQGDFPGQGMGPGQGTTPDQNTTPNQGSESDQGTASGQDGTANPDTGN